MADPGARGRVGVGLALALPFVVAGVLIAWSQLGGSCTELGDVEPGQRTFAKPPCPMVSDDFVYRLDLETTQGPLRVVVDPILACQSVNTLVFLTRAGFYDGMTIHKVEVTEDHGFVQMGDPTGTGRGNAGFTYTAEPPSPVTRYTRGTASMVFAGGDPSTASSQFFIVIDDYDELSYPARTPVNTLVGAASDPESLRTLDLIAAVPRDGDRPLTDIVIEEASVSEQRRFGEEGDPAVPCALDDGTPPFARTPSSPEATASPEADRPRSSEPPDGAR